MESAPLCRTGRSYKTFGWQGISLTVPSGWDLASTRGKYASGDVQLADETAVRMELRWQTGGGGDPPSTAVDTYLAGVRKAAGKAGAPFSVQRDLKLASPIGKVVECYRWVADRQSVAMLSRCAECGRSVHVHLLGGAEAGLKGLARTVFSSLKDHPEDGTHLWSFFDVEFRSPAGLPLAEASLKAGCIRMQFARGLRRLEFVRLSLAETLLAGTELAAWFRQFYQKPLRRRTFRVRSTTWKEGHPGIAVEGRPWLLCHPQRLLGRRRVLRAACWHCRRTNRLLICCYDGAEAEAAVFEPAVDSFRCCAPT